MDDQVPQNGEPAVKYTVKEMLERIDKKIDDGFDTVNVRLNDHSKRLAAIESEHKQRHDSRETLRNTVIAAAAVIGAYGAVAASIKW